MKLIRKEQQHTDEHSALTVIPRKLLHRLYLTKYQIITCHYIQFAMLDSTFKITRIFNIRVSEKPDFLKFKRQIQLYIYIYMIQI